MEYFRDEHGTWWQLDPEYGIPEEVLDMELVDEMEYLHGACPYCGDRHEGDCFDEYPDY